jgi:osmotically-inducible protein OsmY
MSDGELRDHVRDALYREPALATCVLRERVKGRLLLAREPAEPRGDLCVEVDDGVVFLEGEAPSLSHRRLAVALAWWVPGSRDVVDRLEVVPPEEDSDAELVDAIRLLLEADPFVDAGKVSVWAEDGVVTLQGLVPKVGERDFAEHDVWYVEGVRGVKNDIRVAA